VAEFENSLNVVLRFLLKNPMYSSSNGRPSQFALIRSHARRLDDSASVFVSHSLESWISHQKESELHLTASVYNTKAFTQWMIGFECFGNSLLDLTKGTPK